MKTMRLFTWLSLSAALILTTTACKEDNELRKIIKQNAKAVDLKRVATEQELLLYLRNGVIASTLEAPGYMSIGEASDSAASSPGGYSQTNLQVTGVDESDLVKYDGNHLFIADSPDMFYAWSMLEDGSADNATDEDYPSIRVMATAQNPASSEEVSTYQLSSPGINIHGLYRDANDNSEVLVAVTKTINSYYMYDLWYDPWAWDDGRTGVHLIDASNPAALNETFKLEVEGQLVESRKVGDKIYLVTRYSPNIEGLVHSPVSVLDKIANQEIVDSYSLNELLPEFKIDGEVVPGLLKATDCYIPESTQENEGYGTLMTLTTVDLSGNSVKSQCISAYSDGIFASTTGVYLFASGEEDTAIHKLSYTDDNVEYLDTGYVKGSLGWRNPAFRIGENNNVLSVLSSYFESEESSSLKHRLTMLSSPIETGDDFVPLSVLPNESHPEPIGKPNEDIFAVRYVGSRGYAVTFEQIDPLYVFDLSNPADPKIAGELEIPGVSEQLHPIGDNYLIGIGYDFDQNTQFFSGVKVELFDVSDMTNPQSVDQIVYGKGGSYSLAISNHHAFSFLSMDEDNHRLTLPVSLYDTVPDGVDPNDPNIWYDWTNSGLHLIEINTGEIAGLNSAGALITETNELQNYPEYGWNVRSVIHGDSVYFSDLENVWSIDWATPEVIDGPK